jgi:hypothetical protein
MAAAILTHPVTARVFLLGGDQDSGQALAHALDEQGVRGFLGDALQNLSRSGQAAVSGEVATAVQGLLDLDLGDLVLGGWCKQADLRAAARRTAATPGSAEVVELVTHRITSTHSPSVDLLVDGARVATVRFELCVEFVVKGVVATVRDGRLVAVRFGVCDVTATLSADGRQLATRQAQLQLPLVVRLGDGVPLLRAPSAAGPLPAD